MTATRQKIFSVLGDSIAMVRPEDGLFERDLYSCKLQRLLGADYCVVNKGKVGNNSALAVTEDSIIYHVRGAGAEYFSIQIGVVDCAPRMYTEEERRHLKKLVNYPLLGNLIKARIRHQSLRRYQITQNRQIVLTPPEDFESHYRVLIANIKKFNPVQVIFIINIGYPGGYFSARNYGIEDNIQIFNEILQRIINDNSDLLRLVDVHSFTREHPQYILADGHHFGPEVHTFITNEIYKSMLHQS
jgi:hypothetical protein